MEEGREEWDEVKVASKCVLMYQHKEWTAEELLVFVLQTSAKKLFSHKDCGSKESPKLSCEQYSFTISLSLQDEHLLASLHTSLLIVSFSCSFPPSHAFIPQTAPQSCLGLSWFICSFPHLTGIWSFHFASLYCEPSLPRSGESFAFDWNYITPLAPLQICSACYVPGY